MKRKYSLLPGKVCHGPARGEEEEPGDGGAAEGGGQGPQGGQTAGQGNFSSQLTLHQHLFLTILDLGHFFVLASRMLCGPQKG